jgi:pyruvate carboxylase subunit A
MKTIKKILIANRGEIALRIIRACEELNITSVAMFSEVDIEGIWVRKADESYPITGNPIEAYLDYKRIINLAIKAGCDAIHPGYGFLSESAEFAEACAANGLIFIGPRPEHIALFGDKTASKAAMKEIGVPVIEGTDTPVTDIESAKAISESIGFPVIIKAAFGGGGRGMRIVKDASQFEELFESATQESIKFFGRGELFIEKYVENPRHIEVQIMADRYGNVIHLGERDCSIQRRHQKVIEISPSPRLNDDVRQKLFDISIDAMKRVGYESVGTVEYLVDEQDTVYFIEMNTRVQVEHPVSEIVSGIDIIQKMIRIAEGEQLGYTQEQVSFRGYAIELRINAEDPQVNFRPSAGTITHYSVPGGPGVRIDSSAYAGYEIQPYYDSMVGKLIVHAESWESTVNKARRALEELHIEGIPTNIPLHRQIVRDQTFIDGLLYTRYLDDNLERFNFESNHRLEQEQSRMATIANVIGAIKEHKLTVRH